ncbi:hypothetical protein [Leptospira mtsangambouensis]|uniref:AbiU2 domain-containing protein n=1 Tax=Leptospira mtsangambouensis TaxID=2484912 RepID=UPI001EEB218B|nr:hypothetical protein [Leptospira mtsangambouensis]MCG6142781.1 hypothetical protein [Leptospira mtsangambouensis]
MNPIEKYLKSIDTYSTVLFSSISLKLAIFKGFDEKLKINSKEFINISPILPFVLESLQVDCVISIYKLIEKGRSENTIHKFLKFISDNQTQISINYPSLTSELIKKHYELMNNIENDITKIGYQRNKYFAHSDNIYFHLQGKLFIEFPETYKSLSNILNVIIKIISDHHQIINKSIQINMAEFAYLQVDRLYNSLQKSNEI